MRRSTPLKYTALAAGLIAMTLPIGASARELTNFYCSQFRDWANQQYLDHDLTQDAAKGRIKYLFVWNRGDFVIQTVKVDRQCKDEARTRERLTDLKRGERAVFAVAEELKNGKACAYTVRAKVTGDRKWRTYSMGNKTLLEIKGSAFKDQRLKQMCENFRMATREI